MPKPQINQSNQVGLGFGELGPGLGVRLSDLGLVLVCVT